VRELLDYDSESGVFRWRVKRRGGGGRGWVQAGWVAGAKTAEGYWQIGFGGKTYRAARLAWIYANGQIPSGMSIDHRDGDRLNNCLKNLRLADVCQQKHNAKLSKYSTSGIRGVSWSKATKKWRVVIGVRNHVIFLGNHDSFEAACQIRAAAEEAYYGEFRRSA
jgi:hypothetical protein